MGCSNSKDEAVARGGAGWPKKASKDGGANGGSRLGVVTGDLRYNMLKATKTANFEELYELQEGELGSAAMGCVVRGARKKRTGEMFACKTFLVSSVPKRSQQKRVLDTLRNEIDLLRSLDHPNIVRAYESYRVGHDLHLIMELCRGGDLNARTYTEAQAATVVRQTLSALNHAHMKGICHRDLKFENILWESKAEDAHIKLIDFGMSARFQEGMTMNERVGSVYTMAPEVLHGEYTKKADLWSVGCITFHLISGSPPFECEEEVDTMKRTLAVKYFWPHGSTISSEAKQFVYHLLKFDPRSRWTIDEAMNSAWLRRFAPGGPDATPPPSYASDDFLSTSVDGSGGCGATGGAGGKEEGGGNERWQQQQQRLQQQQQLPLGQEGCSNCTSSRRPSIRTRMLTSMRDYKSYGSLRRIALMVVAYNQAPEKLRDLRKEFMEIDTERNGIISRGELQAALTVRGVAHEEIEELFASLDVDQSGDIHYTEFLAATIEAVGATEEERLRLAFERLDTDESGYITLHNLKEIMGPSYDDDAIRHTLEEADAGKDGRVDWQEFLGVMRGCPPAVQLVEEQKAVEELKDKLSPGSSVATVAALGTVEASAATPTVRIEVSALPMAAGEGVIAVEGAVATAATVADATAEGVVLGLEEEKTKCLD